MRLGLKGSVAAVALMAALLPVEAMAQANAKADVQPSPPSPDPATAAGADQSGSEQGLQDVIVTAQRRAENLQKAAIAVAVVDGDALVNQGIATPSQLTKIVPALTVPQVGASNFYFLRGVGNFAVTPFSDPAVAFNYDGVYIARPNGTSATFFDLQRVEVLKGPQGTLYGRNATGGAINVLPTQPEIGSNSGYLTTSYGNYDAFTLEGALNLALGDNGALRVSGNLVQHDGYLDDGTSDARSRALRVQMKSELTPRLTVRVSGDYAHTGGIGTSGTYTNVFTFVPPLGQYVVRDAGFDRSQGIYSPAAVAFRRTVAAGPAGRTLDDLAPYPHQNNDFFGANAQIDLETGAGTLSIIPAWRYGKVDNLTGTGFIAAGTEKDDQYSVEARFVGKRLGIFDYTAGLYYFAEDIKGGFTVNFSAAEVLQNFRTDTRSYAGYGRLTAHLSDRLRLVGGLRYTHDRKSFDGSENSLTIICVQVTPAGPVCPNAPLFPTVRDFSQLPFPYPAAGAPPVFLPASGVIVQRSDTVVDAGQSKGKLTYRGAVEFDVAEKSLIYASVETGFRSGGFSLATGYETYAPEYLTAYTLGLKNRLLHNRIQLNVEGFYWEYRDQQIAHAGLDKGGEQNNFVENVGSSTIKGAEAELRFLLTRTTLLSADAQYLDTDYKTFRYQVPAAPGTGAPPFVGCNVSPSATAGFFDVDCSGKPAFNSPKWTINLGAQQTIPVGRYKLVAGVDTQYRSRRYIGFEYRAEQTQEASWITNAQLTVGPSDERWSVTGFVRNIGDKRLAVFSSVNNLANLTYVATDAPRTYGVRLSGRF